MRPSQYKNFTPEELESHFSDYLIDSWSHSRVSQFARNQKEFERLYLYRYKSKSSATTIAGQAYHHALEHYFKVRKTIQDDPETQEVILDLASLEAIAFDYIENVEPKAWKIQKTTPTVAACIEKANKSVVDLLRNFFSELGTYEDEIEEIIDVEVYCDEFVIVNGVEIPLPCHAKIDLIVKTTAGKVRIIDHKSKSTFTDEKELALGIGPQAITYVNTYESKTGLIIDEVAFVENKMTQNRDKSPQIKSFVVDVTKDTRRLYEALLYEPLRCMIEAVSNPDHIFLINPNDNFVDMAELHDFWALTQLSEITDFDIQESKRELMERRHKKIKDASLAAVNPKIIKHFKESAAQFIEYDLSKTNMTQSEKIEHVLRTFGAQVKVAHVFDGYSSNTYLLEVSAGVKISSIKSHQLDLANALDVSNVRISRELTVYEGKSYLGIEFSKKREKTVEFNKKDLVDQKIPLGKDNLGNTIVWDLNNQSSPHMLVAGATGSGKSVSLRSTIEYAKLAKVDRIIVLDPKYEFVQIFQNDKKITVINDILEIEEAMAELVKGMNELVKYGKVQKTLIVFDEFADALAQSRKGKQLDIMEMVQVGFYAPKKGFMGLPMPPEPKMQKQKTGQLASLEENLRILAQKGRSVGFRIITATQRASAQIITGDTKANFPCVLCFRVPKAVDSRVVLDEEGAETLAGHGDGLFRSPEYPELTRIQAYYIPS